MKTKVMVFSRKKLIAGLLIGATAAAAGWALLPEAGHGEASPTLAAASGVRSIQLVTGEFKSTLPDGRQIEAYRWDPGTVYVKKGETVRLSIYGVNGTSHPFVIEGLGVRGEVQKGKETVVSFKAEKAGVYRLVCQAHSDIAHNGPMIGYIVVD